MPEQGGDFIWYELLTPDADGAKRFYDSVVGWSIDGEAAFPNGYRMIGRYDGKNAGGLLPLNEEMAAHGARPMWLGYVAVADVDGRQVIGAPVAALDEFRVVAREFHGVVERTAERNKVHDVAGKARDARRRHGTCNVVPPRTPFGRAFFR